LLKLVFDGNDFVAIGRLDVAPEAADNKLFFLKLEFTKAECLCQVVKVLGDPRGEVGGLALENVPGLDDLESADG
jgi:hypothetical protein